ncbi:uncharacterized protein LOC135399946 [Ornithodoros turicata]|uniref:uncharacterized protein LOC135399946 n=1 Tax=Ornithodoros turicata TaxID=34597 RepID=UPI00313A2870
MTADLESQVEIQGCTSWNFQRYKRGTLTAHYNTVYGSVTRIFALPCIPWLPKGQRTFRNVCDLLCGTTVLVILKFSLVYQVLQLVVPGINRCLFVSIPTVGNYKFQSLPGTLIGVIAADLFWSNKAVLCQLLESSQPPRARNSCFGWRMIVALEVCLPVLSMYTARVIFYWASRATSMYFSLRAVESVLCLVHMFLVLSIFELLCRAVSHKLEQTAEKIDVAKAVITREELVKLTEQWDHYTFLMQDLCGTFEVFLWVCGAWMLHCFLAFMTITPNWMGNFAYQAPFEQLVFVIRTTFTVLQIFFVMMAMVQPRRSLQDVTILQSSEHVTLHIGVQRFLWKIEHCQATTFFKNMRLSFICSAYVLTVTFLIRLSLHKKVS